MSSRGHIVVDLPTHVIVRVDHLITTSFSRSVLPTSTRAWHRAINCSTQTRCRTADLAPNWTVNGRKCVSYVAFGPTHEASQAALDAYLSVIQGLTTAE